jgi:hypothetical protein
MRSAYRHSTLPGPRNLGSALSHVEQRVVKQELHVFVCWPARHQRARGSEGAFEGKSIRIDSMHFRARFEGQYCIEMSECGVPGQPNASWRRLGRDRAMQAVRLEEHSSRWLKGPPWRKRLDGRVFFESPGPEVRVAQREKLGGIDLQRRIRKARMRKS